MDPYRLSAAGGALALHAVALASVLALASAPSMKHGVESVQVILLSAPEPLPPAHAPAPTEPPARPAAPEPVAAPARSPARAALARARAVPPAATAATPVAPAATRVAEPPPAPAPLAEPASVPSTTISGAAAPPAAVPATSSLSTPSAATTTATTATTVARGNASSAPRIDANWRGNLPPPYPGMARRMGDQGEVRLDVRVDADGRVTEVRLRQSSGSTLLDRTAIDTVRAWRFKPATIDGQPVAEWYHDWRWVFRLEG